MKKHRDALSRTTLKSIYKGNKYTRVKRTKPFPDMRKQYIMRKDGWRVKNVN